MQIHIHANAFELTDSIKDYVEEKLALALSWNQDDLTKISVRLADINGPRGGADKSCHLLIVLKGKKQLVIEDVQADLYVAIDRAIERGARSVSRQIARHREIDHQRIRV